MNFIIATRNAHKVGEIRAILGNDFVYRTLRDFPGSPNIPEHADTFAGNAALKSVGLARWLEESKALATDAGAWWVLADDSGLEVDGLNGAPGVHSARFAAMDSGAGGNSPDAANNAKLLRMLAAQPSALRTARFRCVIALSPVGAPDETTFFDGTCEGRIIESPRGVDGFGYDPLFVPKGFEQTFAELGEEAKNRISHRGAALRKLRDSLALPG